MIDKIFTFGAKINPDTAIPVFLGIIIFIGIIFNIIKRQKQKKWIKKKVVIIGPKILKEHFDGTTFIMLASETGTNEGFIYESQKYVSRKDDSWLTGKINGMETELLINPDNPQKYQLKLNDVPPSQYA